MSDQVCMCEQCRTERLEKARENSLPSLAGVNEEAWDGGPRVGVKDDQTKPMWNLLPERPVRLLVDVLTFGARKYAPGGWKQVPDARERYYAALMRHLNLWRQGETNDPESGLHHLAHAFCNLAFLIEIDLGIKET